MATKLTEPIQEDWPQKIDRLKSENARLKIQIGLLKTEVAKWKRAHYFANKDRARIERQEIERIKEIENEQDQ